MAEDNQEPGLALFGLKPLTALREGPLHHMVQMWSLH